MFSGLRLAFDEVSQRLAVKRGALVSVVRLNGVIGDMGGFRRGLSMATLAPLLERAFKPRRLAAVALAVNSPGGSPVQSALIAARIRALAEEKQVPVLAFAEDVAASGGYWLACAADEIIAERSSIIGSIGVVSGGFGFTDLIAKLGIERRLHTAGDKKAMLDPFQPEKVAEVRHLKALQKDIHQDFIDMVRARRGDRLKGTDKQLFSGAFWTGTGALDRGLVDSLGDMHGVLRRRFGDDVRLRPIALRRPLWQRWRTTAEGRLTYPAGLGDDLLAAVEERVIWGRFGL